MRLRTLSINVLSVAYTQNQDDKTLIDDRVDDSVIAHPNAVLIITVSELLTTMRTRVDAQRFKSSRDPLPGFFGNGLK
jgi:hypothetical protein